MKPAPQIAILLLATAAGFACAQISPNTSDANMPRAADIVPMTTSAPATTQDSGLKTQDSVSPEARELLTLLQDRKKTLKDFTAKIQNAVKHVAGDIDGNIGTCDYIDDPAAGVRVSAHFTADTDEDGKPVIKHERIFIFDSKAFTMIDFKAKEFKQQTAPPGKPFDPTSLDSALPVPIGLKVDDVIKNFVVTLQPSTDPNQQTLRLIPRVKGKIDYKQIDLTIDKKLQLPVKVVMKATGGDITTLKFLDPQINAGKAKLPDITPPKDSGWTIEIK